LYPCFNVPHAVMDRLFPNEFASLDIAVCEFRG